jgi:signal transduction histidine kinase
MIRRGSFRLWLLVALLVVGALGVFAARMAIGRIQDRQEETSDRAKDDQIARAIAAQVQAGADPARIGAIQSALPNDQLIVYRDGVRIFTGPAMNESAFELEAAATFSGGRVIVRDYHSPAGHSSLQLTLVLVGWGLLVAAAALAAAWLLGRAVQAPIDRAVSAADRVAAGDLGARIGPAGTDEFARLAAAFDSMAGRLESADHDQRQFLADVAHEIATPINAVSGLATALADGTLTTEEERADAASLIEVNMIRLGTLLEDLRRLTRLDLAEPVRREDMDVADLCRSLCARFRLPAADAGLDFSVRADQEHLTTDRRLLETVLDNFVSNAIRYTPRGGQVTVRATRGGHAVVFSVADTGIGIRRHDVERIFDRFYRVDEARDRVSGGAGLGLPLAQRAADALGARLEVLSQPGRGSEFRVVLPADPT